MFLHCLDTRDLGSQGIKSLLAVPISFVSEHIETLEEIDMEYRELAQESGIVNVSNSGCELKSRGAVVQAKECAMIIFLHNIEPCTLVLCPAPGSLETLCPPGYDAPSRSGGACPRSTPTRRSSTTSPLSLIHI